jgi:hypothetical protein
VHTIKLTPTQEITPCQWVHPGEAVSGEVALAMTARRFSTSWALATFPVEERCAVRWATHALVYGAFP